MLNNNIGVVFYDMTTLYLEASDEDDLRKTGFSKDGKHQCPQTYIGLLVGLGRYAIGYDIFEGDTHEGHTLIPFIEKISRKLNLNKPIVVADAGLLSNENIAAPEGNHYECILGARLKNETQKIKSEMLTNKYTDGTTISFNKTENTRVIVNFFRARAKNRCPQSQTGLKWARKAGKIGQVNQVQHQQQRLQQVSRA